MPNLTGYPQTAHGNTTSEDTSAQITLGTRQMDASGNEYIYLQGTASTTTGSVVLIQKNFATKLADTDDTGALAVAGTAVGLAEYGWYLIFGSGTACTLSSMSAGAALYLTASSGYIDDTDAAGEAITGAASFDTSSGSATTIRISYPHTYNAALD